MYKPAPYLSIHHGHALDLIRLTAQAWPTKYIPNHLHFSGRKARQEYQHRHCEYCHQQGVLGDETHIFLTCPATASLIGETVVQINKKLRLFDVLPWSSFTDTQRVSILLGTPPLPSSRNTRRGGCRSVSPCSIHTRRSFGPQETHRKTNLILGVFLNRPVPQSRAASRKGDIRES